MNYKRAKILVIAFLVVMTAFFTSDFQLIDIEKTAIIVALGIDYEENGYDVTVQIAVPQSGDFSADNGVAVLSAKGKTVYEAIEQTAQRSGWYPELSFCNMIVFGEKTVEHNFIQLVDYLFASRKFQNSAILAAADGLASDVLKYTTSLDGISSFALQKILLRNVNRANSVLVTDIREFCANNRSVSDVCFLPLIKSVKNEEELKGGEEGESDTKTSAFGGFSVTRLECGKSAEKQKNGCALLAGNGSAGGGSAGNKGSGSGGGEVVFEASSALVFSGGKKACVFNKEQTLCYNLLYKKVYESFVNVGYEANGKKVNSLIALLDNKATVKVSVSDGIPRLVVNLDLVCRREETDVRESLGRLTENGEMSEAEIDEIQKRGEKVLCELIEKSKTSGCDFFKLKEYVYRYLPERYAALKDGLLHSMTYEVSVKCRNYN